MFLFLDKGGATSEGVGSIKMTAGFQYFLTKMFSFYRFRGHFEEIKAVLNDAFDCVVVRV